MKTELRCDAKMFAEVLADDDEIVIETKCSSVFCGARAGVVVIHRFDLSGKLLETRRFRNPPSTEGRK